MAEEPTEDGRLTVWVICDYTESDRIEFTHEFFSPHTNNARRWKWGSQPPKEAELWMKKVYENLIVFLPDHTSVSEYLYLEKSFNLRVSFFAEFEDYEPFEF